VEAVVTSSPPLLSVAEAADLLHISRSRAYELARRGELPGLARLGSQYVVKTAALHRWLRGDES